MQDSRCPPSGLLRPFVYSRGFHSLASSQSQILSADAMEIGGLLNTRHAVGDLRQPFQHPMHMDHRAYSIPGPSSSLMNHQHAHQMSQPPSMTYPSMVPIQQANQGYPNEYDTRSDSQEHTGTDDLGVSQTKLEDTGAQKQFPCSTCNKAFARRSDLARHGERKSMSN